MTILAIKDTALGVLEKLASVSIICASFLKLHAICTVPFVGPLAIQYLCVGFVLTLLEFLVGVLLFDRGGRLWVTWVSILLFTCFSIMSGIILLENSKGCPCFGLVEISPKYLFIYDILVMCVLLLAMRSRGTSNEMFSLKEVFVATVTFSVIASAMFATSLNYEAIGIRSPRMRIRTSFDIGESSFIAGNKVFPVSMRVYNSSLKTDRLVGGGASCGGYITNDFPIDVLPSSTSEFNFMIVPRNSMLPVKYTFQVRTLHSGTIYGTM